MHELIMHTCTSFLFKFGHFAKGRAQLARVRVNGSLDVGSRKRYG